MRNKNLVATDSRTSKVKTDVNNSINKTATILHVVRSAGRIGMTQTEIREALEADGITWTPGQINSALKILSGRMPGQEYRNELKIKARKRNNCFVYWFNTSGTVRVSKPVRKSTSERVSLVKFL